MIFQTQKVDITLGLRFVFVVSVSILILFGGIILYFSFESNRQLLSEKFLAVVSADASLTAEKISTQITLKDPTGLALTLREISSGDIKGAILYNTLSGQIFIEHGEEKYLIPLRNVRSRFRSTVQKALIGPPVTGKYLRKNYTVFTPLPKNEITDGMGLIIRIEPRFFKEIELLNRFVPILLGFVTLLVLIFQFTLLNRSFRKEKEFFKLFMTKAIATLGNSLTEFTTFNDTNVDVKSNKFLEKQKRFQLEFSSLPPEKLLESPYKELFDAFSNQSTGIVTYNEMLENQIKILSSENAAAKKCYTDLATERAGALYESSEILKKILCNNTQTERISGSFLLRQKMGFQFKDQFQELGGDICIIESIELLGRVHLIFANVDAKGFSQKGATGAMVAAVVLRSIIERAAKKEFPRDTGAVKFLRYLYHEMQRGFSFFEGVLECSAIFGLVDDESGIMHYINASHPTPIIYRKGKAQVLEQKSQSGFFGRKDNPHPNDVEVMRFFMQRGDVVIIASDGRAGLYPEGHTNTSELSQSIKETSLNGRFIVYLEQKMGRLENIASELSEGDQLKDDLSILRLEWQGA